MPYRHLESDPISLLGRFRLEFRDERRGEVAPLAMHSYVSAVFGWMYEVRDAKFWRDDVIVVNSMAFFEYKTSQGSGVC